MNADCWSFWEEDCGWKAESDWRERQLKQEQEEARRKEEEATRERDAFALFYLRSIKRYKRPDEREDRDENKGE